jgi:hypothetical protein
MPSYSNIQSPPKKCIHSLTDGVCVVYTFFGGPCISKNAALYSLFYLETALHVLGCTSTHHQERIQLYLQHLVFVTPLLLSAAIVEELELRCCVTLHLVGHILEYSYDARNHESSNLRHRIFPSPTILSF